MSPALLLLLPLFLLCGIAWMWYTARVLRQLRDHLIAPEARYARRAPLDSAIP
jgi:hypothetical protein